MDPSVIIELIVLLLLLVLSGFFSSCETALTTANLNKLKVIIDEKVKDIRRLSLLSGCVKIHPNFFRQYSSVTMW